MPRINEQGYTIAMVADGLVRSFRNTMEENGLDHIFTTWVISETVGVEKPNQRMFETALSNLGLTEADKPRIIMVGNNLSRENDRCARPWPDACGRRIFSTARGADPSGMGWRS